jgi:hypothetical protein
MHSTGKVLEVYDIQSPIMIFRMISVPIKYNGYTFIEDDIARKYVRAIIDSGIYERVI